MGEHLLRAPEKTVAKLTVSIISDLATVVAKIVEVCVEAVPSREEVDRRVLTADSNEALGLINCERALLGQPAKEETPLAEWHRDLDSLRNSAEMGCSEVQLPEKVEKMVTRRAETKVGRATYHATWMRWKLLLKSKARYHSHLSQRRCVDDVSRAHEKNVCMCHAFWACDEVFRLHPLSRV